MHLFGIVLLDILYFPINFVKIREVRLSSFGKERVVLVVCETSPCPTALLASGWKFAEQVAKLLN